jgi:multidrug efflux pump subunit AcrA (membrane-fusion protein)
MNKLMRGNRWKMTATASMLVVVVSMAGCSQLSTLSGGTDTTAQVTPDATDTAAAASPDAATTATPSSTNTTASRPGLGQDVAARIGAIAQTLSLTGKVSAVEEVPLSFNDRLVVQSVLVKPGDAVTAGQALITTDASEIQTKLDQAQSKLNADTAALAQTLQAQAAQQAQAQQQAQAAQQSKADRVAAAQTQLAAARANLQKLQAGPSSADLQAAQNAVTSAQLAEQRAESDQSKTAGGADPTAVHAAEQELANAQAAVNRAQADLDRIQGTQSSSTGATQAGPFMAQNISPSKVSVDQNNPANNYGFQAVAVDPARPTTVYVGTCYQGLWKSTDSGQTWNKVNTGTNGSALDSGRLWSIAIDPTNPQVIYTTPGYGVGGLWKSTDSGASWTNLLADDSPVGKALGGAKGAIGPSNVVIDPANHLHLLVSSHFLWGGKYASSNAVGVLESSDGGANWTIHTPIPNSGAEHYVGLIDSTTWLEASNTMGTYRTTDAGATWTKVSDADGQVQNLLAVNGVVYLPSPTGMLRSTDKGATWQTVGPGGLAVVSDGVNLYTQESGSGSHSAPLYYSALADGTNWTQYSTQTMCISSVCNGGGWMGYDSANHLLYSSNWGAGVWKLGTMTGTPATAAQVPGATGAGTAANGGNDVLAARQRLQTAQDNADAARAKLQALTNPDQNALDQAQLNVNAAQLAVQAAQAHLVQLKAGPAPADLQAAQDAVKQAQSALDRAQATQVPDPSAGTDDSSANAEIQSRQAAIDQDNSDISSLQQRLDGSQLVAPFDGTIVSIRVKAGDTVDSTKSALSIAKPGVPVLRATLAPADVDKATVGQTALIHLQGQPDTAPGLTGTVTSVTPNAAGTTKSVAIDVDWQGSPPKLNSVASIGLVLQQKDDALLVPKKAVHTLNSKSFVDVVDGRTKKVVYVQLGIVSSTDAEIVSGLQDGQVVAVGP